MNYSILNSTLSENASHAKDWRRLIHWTVEDYDGPKVTTYTTHQWYVVLEIFCVVCVGKPLTRHVGGVKWYVVLEVFCVVYVGKPPTRHVGGVKWYVVLEVFVLCMSVNLQHDTPTCRVGGLPTYRQNTSNTTHHFTPPTCRVGGLPTYTTQNTSNTTYHCYVVLEVYRHTQHKIPPNQIKSKFISRHITFKKFRCNNLQCTYNMSWGVAWPKWPFSSDTLKYNINIHIIQSVQCPVWRRFTIASSYPRK